LSYPKELEMELRNAQIGALRTLLAKYDDCNDLNISKQNIAGRLVVSSASRNSVSYIEPDGRIKG
jgi:hypothetical protein